MNLRRRIKRSPVVERFALRTKNRTDWIVARLVLAALAGIRHLPAERATAGAAALARTLAPILPRTRLARRNLRLAFPDLPEAKVRSLSADVWGNVASTLAEYVFLDRLFDFDPGTPGTGRFDIDGIDTFLEVRDSGRPTIIFTAHTGNWEVLPVAAAAYGLQVTALFRPPNNRHLAEELLDARTLQSGGLVPSKAGAAWALANVLERNGCVGVLVDQKFAKGPVVDFLGRPASANPLAAKLARRYDADVYPARSVRLPNGRFRIELGERLELPRTDGEVDVGAATQAINTIVEGWVKERPAQWLWLHDRWRIKRTTGREPQRAKRS